jgi:hypothetical protein
MCELLKHFPGWEAIKTTKGHYRSCGKDPHTCCVSHLLSDQPSVLSGRRQTYQVGKDTGRYWDAGAANVHWVIATEEQIGAGIKQALERVQSAGVLIEGNSFSEYVPVSFMIMVGCDVDQPIKRSARRALPNCSALFVSSSSKGDVNEPGWRFLENRYIKEHGGHLRAYTESDFAELVRQIQGIAAAVAAA